MLGSDLEINSLCPACRGGPKAKTLVIRSGRIVVRVYSGPLPGGRGDGKAVVVPG
jgi:hypothetical protein